MLLARFVCLPYSHEYASVAVRRTVDGWMAKGRVVNTRTDGLLPTMSCSFSWNGHEIEYIMKALKIGKQLPAKTSE